MCKYFIFVGLFLLLINPAFAVSGWVDTWNNFAYLTTNGESKNFSTSLLRSEIRAGLFVTDTSSEIPPFGPYAVSILVASPDKNYWNNELALGYGIRIFPFVKLNGPEDSNNLMKDIKIFAEVLSLSNLKDDAAAKTNKVPSTDKRFGVDLYHEWNEDNPDKKEPWSEMWSNLSYRTTNFYETDFNNYVFSHQQKFGIHLDNYVAPYLRADLTASGKSYPWLNSLYFGVGIKAEPFRGDSSSALKNFKLYLETMSILWYKEKDSRPNSDIRFGMEYRLYL